ncbi:MAG: hypothetical protein ACAH95_12735 [Fimbriimonas sp.]
MKLNKPLIWIIVAVIAIVGIRVAISALNAPNDQEQIQLALKESIKASKEGRPGGVMDKLSVNLKLNDLDTSGNRNQIANYIRQNQPDVTVVDPRAVITGDEAQIKSPVQLSMSLPGMKVERQLEDVTLVFRREDDRAYLIFPTKKWKLAEIHVPEESVSAFMQM